jgi:rhamnulokinase
MSVSPGLLLAVDLGASSGRVVLGRVGAGTLELTELHRFRNGPVALPDGLHWDVLGLYLDVLQGLRAAPADVVGVAVDAWGVDYGLLDEPGALVGNPFHYRDRRTRRGVDSVHNDISATDLYRATGIQHMPINTVFQLAAEEDAMLDRAAYLLLIPDLIGYWLTGKMVAERTNASTTALLDANTGDWSATVFDATGLREDLLPPVVDPGTRLGPLRQSVRAETGLGAEVGVSTVGSHDTASAVVGVPATSENFAYISCGTWGLVGVELEAPIISDAGRVANFTNERGIDGTIRYLRNVMGLWLLQESMRGWRVRGGPTDLSGLLEAAGELPGGGPTVDTNRPEFVAPPDLPAAIVAECERTGQAAPGDPVAVVRCILDSLAQAFAETVRLASSLSGRSVDAVHLVGGGAQNALLCQSTADALELPVIAGPIEATAIGNLVVQSRTVGIMSGDRWDLRALIARTQATRTYHPGGRR